MDSHIIQSKIYEVKNFEVMLDYDLADLYDVETRGLNQSVRRNLDIFPEDFMFQLSQEEWANMLSQNVMTYREKSRREENELNLNAMIKMNKN